MTKTPKKTKKPLTTSQPFAGIIKLVDGKKKLKINSPQFYQAQLEMFPVNTPITLWLDAHKLKRSAQQNSFYHLYKQMIANETGNSVDELHALFKGKFLSQGISEVLGEKVRVVKSTTELTKLEFGEFLERIEALTGVFIPSTEEYNPTQW